MNGFYFIDKPLDLTSFDVIRQLRKKFQIRKMGHTGTLDPLATGGLFVAVGNYTKLIPLLEKEEKEYEFCFRLGSFSDSLDLGTQVTDISDEALKKVEKNISKTILEQVLQEKFCGEISQVPPKYSALKINGKKALDKVLSGEEFEMKKRNIVIKNIELLDYDFPNITLRARVSPGTYIRTLADDIGKYFDTRSVVTKLRRTKVGKLDITEAVSLENIEISDNYDIKNIFSQENYISLNQDQIIDLNNGKQIDFGKTYREGSILFVVEQELITHVVEYQQGKLIPKRKI